MGKKLYEKGPCQLNGKVLLKFLRRGRKEKRRSSAKERKLLELPRQVQEDAFKPASNGSPREPSVDPAVCCLCILDPFPASTPPISFVPHLHGHKGDWKP